jgi:TolB protein
VRKILVLTLALGAVAATAGHAAPSKSNRIVFASNRGPNVNNNEIFSIRVDGSRHRDLSRNQGHDGGPVWSPDGRYVAFWAERFERGTYVRALYVMRPDGSGQRRLTPPELSVSGTGDPPSWSPDGSRLAFAADTPVGYGIWVVRADGSGLILAAGGGIEPAWSPRSNQIAFVSSAGQAVHIALVEADGTGLRILTTGDEVDRLPAWSPDGRSIAFVRIDSGLASAELYRVRLDGTELTRLAPFDTELGTRPPSWDPNGRRITFSHGGRVLVVSPGAPAPRRLAKGTLPAFSPDGRKIAFVRDSALVVMNSDGTGARTLRNAKGDFFTSGPRWSRDGRTLVFATVRERADHDLYSIEAEGRGLRRLTNNAIDERLPAWSPARRRLAFVRRGHIFVMNASGGNQRSVTRGSYPSWSPTGAEIAFSRDGSVYVVRATGGAGRRLAQGSRPAWSPRGDQIAFVRGLDLIVVRRGSRAERRIAALDCDGSPATDTVVGVPDWSPDGHRLVVPLVCIEGRAEIPSALMVDAASGNRQFLSLPGLDFARLAWSPDGSRISYSHYLGRPRIATARLDGSGVATVTSTAGDDRDLDW